MEESLTMEIERAVAPLLERSGHELVLLQYVPRGRILRVYLDHPSGISVDDCARMSGLIGDLLDAEGFSDRLGESYRLEVSSPGLDRPLVTPQHFKRFLGKVAKIQTLVPQRGRRRFRGQLLSADEIGITLEMDGQVEALEYGSIESARLVPEF